MRRARAFPTYAAIRALGRNGIAEIIERCCDHARTLVAGFGSLAHVEVLWTPTINQGLARFLDPRPEAEDHDHDRRTDEMVSAIAATGEAFFSATTWKGRRAMRVSVCSWRTSEGDVQRTLRAVAALLAN